MERSKKIIRTSLIGIAVNVILVSVKIAVGVLSGSIAVTLDAINNLGDALSSVITIIGTKLAGRAPDKKHPYGYGRIEYLTSVVIAVIVLMAGVTSLKESVESIFHSRSASYSAITLAVIAVAVLVKLVCGLYIKSVGKQINAQALIASGSDSLFDAILSFGTLAAAIVSMVWGISLEGILGVLISFVILKAGVEMLLETLNSIIGARADRELSEALKQKINSYDQVQGCYDLILHNYGPTEIIGSVHIEVEDSMSAREIHGLTRRIALDVYATFGIVLTVGIYAANTSDSQAQALRNQLQQLVDHYPEILQMHGFYAEPEARDVTFDLVVDFKADAQAVQRRVLEELNKLYPDWNFSVVLDSDYSD